MAVTILMHFPNNQQERPKKKTKTFRGYYLFYNKIK
jgi:hypothetical protein